MHSVMWILPALLFGALPAVASPCDPVPSASPPAQVVQVVGEGALLQLEVVSEGDTVTIESTLKQVGTSAILTAGRVPVLDLLRYLQATTGNPVLFASIDRYRSKALSEDASIEVLETIRPLTVTIVEALLATNHIRVQKVTLLDGSEVLHVTEDRDDSLRSLEKLEPAPSPVGTALRPPLLETDGEWGLAASEIGRIVVEVENARIADLTRIVQKLIDDRALEILPIGGKQARHVALQGRAGSIAQARDLLRALDRADLWPEKGSAEETQSSADPGSGSAQQEPGTTQNRPPG